MKRFIFAVIIMAAMVGGNSGAFAMDFDTLSATEKAEVAQAGALIGEPDARTHYENTIKARLLELSADIRRARVGTILQGLHGGTITDDQITRVEAILDE